MFSTMKKQKRAQELIEEAKKALEEIEERSETQLQRFKKLVSEIDTLKSHLARKTLKRFHDLYFTLKGVKPVEMADITEQSYAGQMRELIGRIESVEPIEIAGTKMGKLPAALASLTAAIITLLAALLIGAAGAGVSFDLQNLFTERSIEKILTWIGGGAFAYPSASPLFGGLGLITAAVAAALVTWSVLMAKSSGKNLAAAKKCYDDAKNYIEQKEHYLNDIVTLQRELSQYKDVLDTFDIFMQEYNAILRRILFTEGKEYEEYGKSSKEVVKRAAICAQAIVPILNITIVASDGSPSKQLLSAIEEGKRYSEALT
ncbi:MAG: hypothetical protein L3J42_02490, partial [Hydrogenimonas sp.]|nr:hypothetical protein [Hydrogenimonas sp.]